MNERLPIAVGEEMRVQARVLLLRHRLAFAGVIALHGFAAVAGLVGPRLLGGLVDAVTTGTTTHHIDRVAAALAAFVLAQTVLTWFARRASFVPATMSVSLRSASGNWT